MDSPDKLHFGAAKLSHFRNENASARVASRSIASELKSGAREVCDLPHQLFEQDLPLYEVEAMSLIHGLIARLAWGPLLVSAGAPEGIGFVLRRILRLKSARDVFPNLFVEGGRVVLISEWGSANLEECLWDPSDPEAQQDCMLMREYLNPTPKKPTPKRPMAKAHQNVINFMAWAQTDPEMLRETVRGSLQCFSYFLNLARCCVPHQNLAITSHESFADALLRRVMSAGALTRLAASKTHTELGELAQHLAQADRSEADFAVFQSCLDRLTEDGVLFDAVTERF